MLEVNQIANIFTDKCSATMPAKNYLFIYKRIQELEKERDCYKQQLDILKKSGRQSTGQYWNRHNEFHIKNSKLLRR